MKQPEKKPPKAKKKQYRVTLILYCWRMWTGSFYLRKKNYFLLENDVHRISSVWISGRLGCWRNFSLLQIDKWCDASWTCKWGWNRTTPTSWCICLSFYVPDTVRWLARNGIQFNLHCRSLYDARRQSRHCLLLLDDQWFLFLTVIAIILWVQDWI